MGYPNGTKGYVIIQMKIFFISRNVPFREEIFPFKLLYDEIFEGQKLNQILILFENEKLIINSKNYFN